MCFISVFFFFFFFLFFRFLIFLFFFFNDTATTEIYTLSLHDALPISVFPGPDTSRVLWLGEYPRMRSEEHTSELQSLRHLVCRLLLEKKKKKNNKRINKKKKKKKKKKHKKKTRKK